MIDTSLSASTLPPGTRRDLDGSLGTSAVSWPAIFAGAAGAAALSLILLLLGTGLGLSSVSPWASQGISATAIGVSTVLWLTFTQLAASGMGGYLAGRLRSRWVGTQADEVYFRDTAHGFLAWAIASLATAAFLASAIGSILGTGVQAAGAATSAAAATAATGAGAAMAQAMPQTGQQTDGGQGYFVDALFRTSAAAPAAAASGVATGATPSAGPGTAGSGMAETQRILASALAGGALPAEDASYLAQLVSQRTGIPQAEAQQRVTQTYARMQEKAKAAEASAREAADKARKASAKGALWLFVSLLIGAFVASFAATFGGRHRDTV